MASLEKADQKRVAGYCDFAGVDYSEEDLEKEETRQELFEKCGEKVGKEFS